MKEESKADELNKLVHSTMIGLKEHYANWSEYSNMMGKLASVSKELNEIRVAEIKGENNHDNNEKTA